MLAEYFHEGDMPVGRKFDYPPLLAPGRHRMGLHTLQNIAVNRFDGAAKARREVLFSQFSSVVEDFWNADFDAEIVINGSFLTEKMEPEDIDCKLYYSCCSVLTDSQLQLISETTQGIEYNLVDFVSFPIYYIGHKDQGCALDTLAQGEDYGQENSGEWRKGYASLRIGETHVGLRICR